MAIYTVLAPVPKDGGSLPADPMALVFVKEGFAWPAFLFAGLWLIYRRLWLVLVGYFVVAFALSAVAGQIGGPLPFFAILALHFLFALEANELRRWTLARRGFRLIGLAEGRGQEEAEIRYFSENEAEVPVSPLPPVPPIPPVPPLPRLPRVPSAEAGEVVGLFPAPGAAP